MIMMEIKATIDKADIAALGALKGMANAEALVIGGVTYIAGRVIFRGFAGAFSKESGRYQGVVRFEDGATCGMESADFSPIERAMNTNEREVDDALHGNGDRKDHDRDDD